jgi:hypothetical protein
MSYNGGIDYGLLGDYDALPDIEVVAEGIENGLQELLAIARGDEAGSRQRPVRSRSRISTRPAKTAAASAEPAVALAEQPVLPLPSARVKTGPAADMRAKRNRQRSRRPSPPESS